MSYFPSTAGLWALQQCVTGSGASFDIFLRRYRGMSGFFAQKKEGMATAHKARCEGMNLRH
jgi:hypothetical protein